MMRTVLMDGELYSRKQALPAELSQAMQRIQQLTRQAVAELKQQQPKPNIYQAGRKEGSDAR
jgi:hypothetical protein